MRLRQLSGCLLLLCAARAFALPISGVPLDAPLAQAPVNPELETAQEQIDSGDFEEAVKTLQQALNEPDVSDDQLVEIYRLLGLAHLYLGNESSAREAYEKLLQARPDYELPKSASPRIRNLYARIKEDIKKRRVRPVTITAEPLTDVEGGQPVEVKAKVEDLALGSKAKLYYRRAGAQAYSSVDFARERGQKDQFRATLPAYELPSEATGYEVEYYLEVADAAQRRLAGKGDAYNPLRFTVKGSEEIVKRDEERHWYQNPWVWVGAGALVAAAGAGTYFLLNQRQTGSITITVRPLP